MGKTEFNYIKTRDLIRSCDAAEVLGISREYIRQLIRTNALPPKYIFNANSNRPIYVFDKQTLGKFGDPETRKTLRLRESIKSDLVSLSELAKAIKCTIGHIKLVVGHGYLRPRLTIVGNKRSLFLYDKDEAAAAIRACAADAYKRRCGHTEKTLKIIERIKQLHKQGLNDRDISIKLEKAQPFIFKLRKELGLISNARIRSAKRRAELEKLKADRKAAAKKRKLSIAEARKLKQANQAKKVGLPVAKKKLKSKSRNRNLKKGSFALANKK